MKTRDPDWEARIRRDFADQAMMVHLGMTLDEVAPGRVAVRAPILPHLAQHHGYAHGALAFAAGDTAAGFAAQSVVGPDEAVLTVEMKINLLAPGRGEALLARGVVERAGRRIIVVRADVAALHRGAETPHAVLLGTMAVIPRPG